MKQFYFLCITALACMVITACAVKSQGDTKVTKQVVPVTKLITKDTSLQQAYVADIQAVQNVEIRNRVTGFLERIFVDEGQPVTKGQLLFQISDEEYKAEVARANASLSKAIAEAGTAELEVNRVKLLVDKKVVSPSDLVVARANLKAAVAKIAEARTALTDAKTRLSYTNIRAPFNGVINRIPLKVGSLLDEGALLTTVSDISSVYAYFSVSENEYLRYLKAKHDNNFQSNTVQLTLADGTQYDFAGKIETTASEFEEGTGSIAFRAKFPNPKRLLKHGASGNVVLQTKVDDALILPQKSVFEVQDKNYVYVVDGRNIVKMKSFIPKSRMSHFYIVQSGLMPGEKIVYEGIQNLKDGMQIAPQEIEMGSILQSSL